jgi:hypothetical protein
VNDVVYLLQVHGTWGGRTASWRPAFETLDASTFEDEDEALRRVAELRQQAIGTDASFRIFPAAR